MPKPTVDQLRAILRDVAAATGVSASTICSDDHASDVVAARFRFISACREIGARQPEIAEALRGALSRSRIYQIFAEIKRSVQPRQCEAEVRRIIHDVSLLSKVPLSLICSASKDRTAIDARRRVIERSKAVGIGATAIARALGIGRRSVTAAMGRVDLGGRSCADDLLAFRRGAGFVPLTAVDYATRAGLPLAKAVERLEQCQRDGYCQAEITPKVSGLRIYDLTDAGRGVLAA